MTLVERNPCLLDRDEPRVSELVAAQLAAEGIDVHTATQARRAYWDGAGIVAELDGGGPCH